MFSSSNSLFNLNSVDVLEYVEFDNDEQLEHPEINENMEPLIPNNNNIGANFVNLNNNNNVNNFNNQINFLNQVNFNNSNRIFSNKLKVKCLLAFLRIGLIIFFFFLDGSPLSTFLKKLLSFLMIHEIFVIGNYSLVYLNYFFNRIINENSHNSLQIPRFSSFIDSMNNFLFFSWFVYGNIMILGDKEGVEASLKCKFFYKCLLFQ